MFLRLALTGLGVVTCLTLAVLSYSSSQQTTQSTVDVSLVKQKLPVADNTLPTKNWQQWSSDNQKQLWGEGKTLPVSGANSQRQDTYMVLTSTGMSNALGNPLYQLRLYAKGELLGAYAAVSGRANTQNLNRHRAGNNAPLPDGRYSVSQTIISANNYEVGGRFLPIQPLFRTGRYDLGIHYDPSFESNNGEDGTEGCIALTNSQDLDQVLNYVLIYHPKYLEVDIQ